MKTLIFDIETNGLLDSVTAIHCLVTKDPDTHEVRRFRKNTAENNIDEGLALLDTAERLAGHNIICFDLPALERVTGWTPKPSTYIRDTLVCTRLMWPDLRQDDFTKYSKRVPTKLWGRHSLEAWGYRLGIRKGDFGKDEDGEKAWEQWSPEMEDYCVQDVEVTQALLKKITEQNYAESSVNLEHAFRRLMFLQEQRGFGFNTEAAKVLYATLSKRRLELTTELQAMFPPRRITQKTPAYYFFLKGDEQYKCNTKGAAQREFRATLGRPARDGEIQAGPLKVKEIPFNPGSEKQVAARLIELYGWKPQKFTDGGDPQVTEEVLKSLKFPGCDKLAEFSTIEKRIGQLAEGKQAWLKVERNGRMFGAINTNGAVTGRCTHSHPNMAQVPAVYSPYGKDCRSLFVPTPGYVLVGWDASGLELRCLAHFMAKWDGGQYVQILLEGDIHSENQKAAGLPTRDQAKTFIYAFLF